MYFAPFADVCICAVYIRTGLLTCACVTTQVTHAFDGTTLRLVAGPSATLFDSNDRYREQPFPTPPAAWISLWRKEEA